MLDRAIQALTEAEAAVASGRSSTTAILQEVIRGMEMQDVDMACALQGHHRGDRLRPEGPRRPGALRPMALDRSGRKSSAGGSHRHDQSLGDEELKRDALDALSRRREWPDGMRRYIASLYELDIDTWHESPTSSSARLQSA